MCRIEVKEPIWCTCHKLGCRLTADPRRYGHIMNGTSLQMCDDKNRPYRSWSSQRFLPCDWLREHFRRAGFAEDLVKISKGEYVDQWPYLNYYKVVNLKTGQAFLKKESPLEVYLRICPSIEIVGNALRLGPGESILASARSSPSGICISCRQFCGDNNGLGNVVVWEDAKVYQCTDEEIEELGKRKEKSITEPMEFVQGTLRRGRSARGVWPGSRGAPKEVRDGKGEEGKK